MTLLEAVWHEGLRIFHDRLVGRDAQEQCINIITSVMSSVLAYRGEAVPWVASTLGASSEDRLNGGAPILYSCLFLPFYRSWFVEMQWLTVMMWKSVCEVWDRQELTWVLLVNGLRGCCNFPV